MLKKPKLFRIILTAIFSLIMLSIIGGSLFYLIFNQVIIHIDSLPIQERLDYINDFPTLITMAFVPLFLVFMIYCTIIFLCRNFLRSVLAKSILCIILGALSVILPLMLVYGFDPRYLGNVVWVLVIVLLCASIPYIHNRIFSLISKEQDLN